MTEPKNLDTPIAIYDATLLKSVRIEVLHSEYRDSKAVGKYYAYICYFDENGSQDDFGVTQDFDTPQEAIQNLKDEWESQWSSLVMKSLVNIK